MGFTVATPRERKILSSNGIDPDEVSVILSGDDFIITKFHITGDLIIVEKGDRPWPREDGKGAGLLL